MCISGPMPCNTLGAQRETSDPLELELWMVVRPVGAVIGSQVFLQEQPVFLTVEPSLQPSVTLPTLH